MTMTMAAPRPFLLTLLVVAALVAGAGCGSSRAARVIDVSSDNPCLVLNRVEMQAVIGTPVGGPVTDNVQAALVGERVCQFQTADPNKPLTLVKVGLVSAYADSVFDKYAAAHKVAPVPGLGATAVWDAAANRLLARKHDKILTLLVFGPGTSDARSKATKLAQRALGRL